MKLPNWFKVSWWVLITLATGLLFRTRLHSIVEGKGTTIDLALLGIFVALLLTPIFSEIELFGVKLKQALDDLQKQISTQIASMSAEIQSTVSNTSNINLSLAQKPISDDQLPELKEHLRQTLTELLDARSAINPAFMGTQHPIKDSSSFSDVNDDVVFLFRCRYTIERRLRHLVNSQFISTSDRPLGVTEMTRLLSINQLLHPNIADAIRQIYSVCSPAIHGQDISEAKVSFVRDLFPTVMQALSDGSSSLLFQLSEPTP